MRKTHLADSIARWTMLVLLALLPLFIIPAGWSTPDQSKILFISILLGVALIAWLIARLQEGFVFVPRSTLLAASALLPICYFLSALVAGGSIDSWVSGSGSLDTVTGVALLFATVALVVLIFGGEGRTHEGGDDAITIIRALAAGIGVLVVFQVVRLFTSSWLSLGGALPGSASSLAGTWHDFGIFTGLAVFLCTILWSTPAFVRGWWRTATIALGTLAFLLLIIIGIADVWYVLAVALLVFGSYQWMSARVFEHRSLGDAFWRGAVALVVGVLCLLFAFCNGFITPHLPAALQVGEAEVRPSWQGTLTVGEHVFKGTGFLFGSGPNTFDRAWGQFKPSAINQTQYWSTDFATGVGSIPTAFVTAGLLGIIAWLALLAALIVATWRFVQHERLSRERVVPAATMTATLYLAAFQVLYTPGIAPTFVLFALLGLVACASGAREPLRVRLTRSSRIGLIRIVLVVLFACAVLFAAVYVMRATISDLLVQKSSANYARDNDLAHSLALVQAALTWFPDSDTAHRAAVQIGLLQMQQLIAAGKTTDATLLQTTLSQTIAEGLKAVSINSGDYQNWLTLATLYQGLGGEGVEGAYQNALSAYQKAIAANPTNPLPLIGAAQAAASLNDATSSVQYLTQAIALKPDLAAAYYLRSQVEGAQGTFDSAVQDAQNAVSLAQQDPLGWYNLGSLLYAAGNYQSAVAALQKSVSLQNNYANALFVLSLALDKTGDHQNAIAAMQQVTQLNPTDQTAAQALKNMQAGKPALTPTPASAKKTQ